MKECLKLQVACMIKELRNMGDNEVCADVCPIVLLSATHGLECKHCTNGLAANSRLEREFVKSHKYKSCTSECIEWASEMFTWSRVNDYYRE